MFRKWEKTFFGCEIRGSLFVLQKRMDKFEAFIRIKNKIGNKCKIRCYMNYIDVEEGLHEH